MSDQNQGYGYTEDDSSSKGPALQFGLNSGITNMTKFEFNPNGGKNNTPGEVLDIIFSINGKDVSYRLFPVTKAYGKNNIEITDPSAAEFKAAVQELNGVVVHILKAFVPVEMIKQGFSVPITTFKQFCDVSSNILPQNFQNAKLDVFGQWKWLITGENNTTFVNLPRNVKHGKWICGHIIPAGGEWTESRLNGNLIYVDTNNIEHPFQRTKWYMESNFAKQQKENSMEDVVVGVSHAATAPAVAPAEMGSPIVEGEPKKWD